MIYRRPSAAQRRAWARVTRWWNQHPCVWVSPGRCSGRPCIGGHRLSVDLIADLWWGGSSAVAIQRDYAITREQIVVACWYVARYGTRMWRRRWGRWETDVFQRLWNGRYKGAPLPPRSGDEP